MHSTATKIRALLLLLFALTFYSCNPLTQKNKKLILGEWTFVSYKPHKINTSLSGDELILSYNPQHLVNGFKFHQDGKCENKSGYFDYLKRIITYLGSTTNYKIKGEQLFITNLTNHKPDTLLIKKLTTDTLQLDYKGNKLNYCRTRYKDSKELLFDQITIASTGCYGTCPINYASISRNGKFTYNGVHFSSADSCFTSIISKSKFDSIELAFKKSNPLRLKSNYENDISDMNSIVVTFIRDGKIIKTITDYGHSSPIEFQNAYTSLEFLYQQVKPKNTISDKFLFTLYSTPIIYKGAKIQRCFSSPSEWFYLITQLQNSPKTTMHFSLKPNKYTNNDDRGLPITDGRIFTFKAGNGNYVSYDLGYNYFERNEKFFKRP